jgi:glycosyltransferase involved in cell wall biosynthesis
MKIVHVCLSTKGFSGSERYLIDLINYQSEKHECYFIKHKKNTSKQFKIQLKKNIKVIEIRSIFEKLILNFFINKIKPDIVHTHLGAAGKSIKKKNYFKLIATVHMNYKKKHYINHDGLLVTNPTQEKLAKESFSKNVKKIYHWSCERKKKNHSLNVREILKIPNEAYVFGSIGRFHKQKNFEIIINTFQKINLEDAYLILVGNGHDEFLKYENNNIKILPQQEIVSNYYEAFDCFVMASIWETFGITLIEAMTFDLPIITTIHEGNEEWIKDYQVETFEINNSNQLLDKFHIQYSYGKRKIKYKLDKFDYYKTCNEIEEFYKYLIKN